MTIKINERDSADILDLMSLSYALLYLIGKCPKFLSLKVKDQHRESNITGQDCV